MNHEKDRRILTCLPITRGKEKPARWVMKVKGRTPRQGPLQKNNEKLDVLFGFPGAAPRGKRSHVEKWMATSVWQY